ncbi:MAG TPA: hypothetical protein VK369_10895 [Segetibacter sp.]|nr:hypothetical protein [Segetibacter sp.]
MDKQVQSNPEPAKHPAIEKDDLKMSVNDNPRANENLDESSFEMEEGPGSEITDGEAS